ncbi:glycoside hydrolase family 26 protein [Actinotalea sp. K2]|uniref:glycoside hydrolase family 26 protein n=1 Tax=Actinotalea sp. K2 TaxID=2939438 RepID=UPI002016D4DA|nr:glycosyl hydrolase [Actinotalea sp. K2]MCL3860304.1 glycoside hydrolase [Actinotalea sp. K2]
MSDTRASSTWWSTTGRGLSFKAKAGTAAVAVCLVLTTVAVWTSPSTDFVSADAGTDEAATTPTQEELLRAELASLREELAERDAALAAAETAETEDDAPDPAPEPEPAPPAAGNRQDDGATSRGGSGRTAPAPAPGPTAEPQDSDGPANPSNPSLPEPGAVTPDPQPAPTPAPPAPGAPTPAPPAITAPSKAELLDPEDRYYGMYTVQSPFSWATLDDVSTKTGILPDLAGYFSGWDRDFRPDAVERSWQRGMLPMLTWESRPSHAANNQREEEDYSSPLILDGAFDTYIRDYARGIADLGLPLGLRLNHEMNGDWYPWSEMNKFGEPINGNRPGDYAKVWRHVHDIFEQEGANEYVIWVWAPNIVNNLPDNLKQYSYTESLYPGEEYVDWVGLSAYYRPPYRENQTPTFSWTFDASLDQLRRLTDKPIMLAEIGASEVGGNKPAWVRSFFEALTRPENDDIVGFTWFSLTVTSIVSGQVTTNDWRIDSRANSLAAFREGLHDPATRMGGSIYPAPSTAEAPEPAEEEPPVEALVAPTPQEPTEAPGPTAEDPAETAPPEPDTAGPEGETAPEPGAGPTTPDPAPSPVPDENLVLTP